MEITIDVKALRGALQAVSRAIPTRPTSRVFSCVMIEAAAGTLKLAGFDGATAIQTSVECEYDTPGAAVIPARPLLDLLNKLTGTIILQTTGQQTLVTCGNSCYELHSFPANDYPALPVVDGAEFAIPADAFLEGLNGVLLSASKDEIKQILTGVHFLLASNRLELAATNGHKLSVYSAAVECAGQIEITIPAKALEDVRRLLEKQRPPVLNIQFDNHLARFTLSDQGLTTRLLDGSYPAYQQLIPKEFSKQAVVDRQRLLQAVERLAVFAQQNRIIKCQLGRDSMLLTVEELGTGNGQEPVPCEFEGEPLVVGLNVSYLLESLKSLNSSLVTINLNSPTTPFVIKPLGETNVLHLIMPVMLRS